MKTLSCLIFLVVGLMFAHPRALAQCASEWNQKADVAPTRSCGGATVIDGKIYLIGGLDYRWNNSKANWIYDPASDSWQQKKDMPTGRALLSTVLVDGVIYAIGGGYPNAITAVEAYYPAADSWASRAPLPQPRLGSNAALVDNIIYAFAGAYSKDSACTETYAYSVPADTWMSRAPRPVRGVCGVTAYNGLIYTFGGMVPGGAASQALLVYDPAIDSWTQKKDMPTPRMGMQSVLLKDGRYGRHKIYVIGGYQVEGTALTTVEAYDPFTNTWETKAEMPEATMFAATSVAELNHRQKIYLMGGGSSMSVGGEHTWEYDPNGPWVRMADVTPLRAAPAASAIDGKIYVTGGLDVENQLANSKANWVYDPVSDTWQEKKEMPTGRGFHSSAVVNGVLYAIAGGYPKTMTAVEAYYPAADTWASRAPLPKAVMGIHAAAVDGIIYAIGGGYTSDSVSCETFAYDPVADAWTTKAPRPVYGGCGVAAYNGLIYTFGGRESGGAISSAAWVYDPKTDSWTQKTGMTTARTGMEAVLDTACGKDRIYVMGGYQTEGTALAAVEVYDPIHDTWEGKADMPSGSMFDALCEIGGRIYAMGGAASAFSGGQYNWEYSPGYDLTLGVEEGTNRPEQFALLQNYPNPFNPSTRIIYTIPRLSHVILKVFDILGREVATIVNETRHAGRHSVQWNAAGVPSGVYFYRITAEDFVQTQKMVLIK